MGINLHYIDFKLMIKQTLKNDTHSINNLIFILKVQKSIVLSQMKPAKFIENRSTLLIFRDCLKLAKRMVENPAVTQSVRALIKRQFQKNRDAIDQEQIQKLKMTAARGITNYIIHTVRDQYKLKPVKTIYEPQQTENNAQHPSII